MTTYGPQTTSAAAPPWARLGSHRAGALDVLAATVDAHWPARDHASDGFLGDARHVAEGSGSDHNPWLASTVRAGDFDRDGIDADWFAEHLRALGEAGDPRLAGGGYVIWSTHYAGDDTHWQWVAYHGSDPHTSHVHVSLSRNPAGYESRAPWLFLSTTPPPQPVHPGPVPHWTGHDLTGDGDSLRGSEGDQGPRVEELQHDLNTHYPAYSRDPDGTPLDEDGVWGANTSHVLAEFEHRAAAEAQTPAADRPGLASSDGRDLGHRSAHALHQRGLI